MRRGVISIFIGLILLAAASLLLAYNITSSDDAGNTALQIKADYDVQVKKQEIMIESPAGEMPSLTVDGYPIMGTIRIDAIGIDLPVIDTWSYPMLKKAPCRYSGTAEDGKMIILAHNYDSHFGRLKNLVAGDSVVFTDVNGTAYTYKVDECDTLGGYSLEELTDTEYDLTLFTCTYGGRNRVVIRCNKIDKDIDESRLNTIPEEMPEEMSEGIPEEIPGGGMPEEVTPDEETLEDATPEGIENAE